MSPTNSSTDSTVPSAPPGEVITTTPHGNYGNGMDETLANMETYSRFQIVLSVAMVLVSLTTTYNFILPYFTANDPPWRCVNTNSSHFCAQHFNITIDSDSDIFKERCNLERDEWTYITSKTFSYVTEFDLVCANTTLAAFVMSSFYLGGLIGPIAMGIIADIFGRKPVLLINLFIMICSSILCTFINSIWQLTCINIILGASTMSCSMMTMIYFSEFASPKNRALLYTLLLLCTSISSLIIDAVAYFERNWRELQLYLAFSSILASILPSLLPESPRWMLVIGRVTEAEAVFKKLFRFNGRRNDAIILRPPPTTNDRKYTYLDLFSNFRICLVTLILSVLRATISSVDYSILLESSHQGGDLYQAFAFSILATLPSGILCSYLCNRFGRKKCILGGLFISGVLVGIFAVLPHKIVHLYVLNIIIMSSARFVNMTAYIGINIWIFELYPTVSRSQGMAACGAFEKIGVFSAPFITKVLQAEHHIIPVLLICSMAIVTSLTGLFLPETNRKPTRETFEDFFETKEEQKITARHDMDFSGVDHSIGQNIDDEIT